MAPKFQNGIEIPKNLPENFIEVGQSMTTEELKAVIVESTFTADDMKRQRDEDPKYVKMKEDFKIYGAGYNDVVKAHKAKVAYAIAILTDRGVPLTREDLDPTKTAVNKLLAAIGPEGSVTLSSGEKSVTVVGK